MPMVHVSDDELRRLSARQLGEMVRDRVVGIEHRQDRRGVERTRRYQRSAEDAWNAARAAEREMLRGTGVRGDPALVGPTLPDDDDNEA